MDKIFKALADRNRRKIITMLKEREMTVTEMVNNLEIGQATVSSHLAVLRKAELVESQTKTKWRIYKLNKETLWQFIRELNKFGGFRGTEEINEIILRK